MVIRGKGKAEGYRPYVDGLRAIAILAVIGYHIGVPGFSGGFVGVDVFFVISGFLIIGHIIDQMRGSRFSLTDFYARRVLRLMPLLLTVILSIAGLAALVLITPDEFSDFGRSATAAALMISNHFFLDRQGYFDTAAEAKPLLHTWSLGVEAQFYVAAPVLIWLLTRPAAMARHNRGLFWGAVAIVLVSLAGCVLFTDPDRNRAFFLMVCRAWEFVAGALAAVLAERLRRFSIVTHVLGMLGLAMIVACVYLYSPALLYPSWYPIIPVLGAVFVIAAGEADAMTPVRRLLATPPFVSLGLVSYGWYLWHWPLLTLGRIYRFGDHALAADLLIGGALSLLLATATYFAIERPVARNKSRLLTRRRSITVGIGIAASLAAAVPGLVYQKIVGPAVSATLTAENWPGKGMLKSVDDACIVRGKWAYQSGCLQAASGKTLGLLIGDSHARESYAPLAAMADKANAKWVTLVRPACPPLLSADVVFFGQSQGCVDTWKSGLDALRDGQAAISFAVIQANWGIYVGGDNAFRASRSLTTGGDGNPASDQYRTLSTSLADTVHSLKHLGIQRILIIAPEPQFSHEGAACLMRARKMRLPEDTCARPRVEIEAQHQRILTALNDVSMSNADVRLIDPFAVICDGTTCRQHRHGIPIYVDDNHLSRIGNDLVFGSYAGDFAWLFGHAAEASR
ncbi:MAG TPA: acyltransferase family protein [Dongiaceae bacterium]|nr:acyltransferase family protein [Dongiaceae bacterium]